MSKRTDIDLVSDIIEASQRIVSYCQNFQKF